MQVAGEMAMQMVANAMAEEVVPLGLLWQNCWTKS